MPEAISCCFVIGIVLCTYVCQLSLLIWISCLDRLPEAICCCLQTSTVSNVLLMMNCMGLPVFFVTSADKILPEAICCCLETFCLCGFVDVVLYNCAKTFMVTCANIS